MAEGRVTRTPLYRNRFGLAYVALAIVAGLAAGTTVLLLGRSEDTPVRWSTWEPSAESGGDRVQEIVRHVSSKYRLASGQALVGVYPQVGRVQNVDIAQIMVRKPVVISQEDISYVDGSDSLLFVFCDFDEDCRLPAGPDAPVRERLVRRQAAELALYALKYVSGIDSVVAFLPRIGDSPARQTAQSAQGQSAQDESSDAPVAALFFEREDLERQLERPLRFTLPAASRRFTPETMPRDAGRVDRLTLSRLYGFQVERGSTGAVLVLDPTAVP